FQAALRRFWDRRNEEDSCSNRFMHRCRIDVMIAGA
ncbi:MAG: hypothetical protein, partial [Olavius algarvensis Gamma 1 endosymbiont]